MGKKQQTDPVDVDEFVARVQQDAHVAAAIKEHTDILGNLLTVEAQVCNSLQPHVTCRRCIIITIPDLADGGNPPQDDVPKRQRPKRHEVSWLTQHAYTAPALINSLNMRTRLSWLTQHAYTAPALINSLNTRPCTGYEALTIINAQHPKKQQVKDEERVFSSSSQSGQSEAVCQRAMAAAQQPLATAPSLAASAEPSAVVGSAQPSA